MTELHPATDVRGLFTAAMTQHRAGRLADAEAGYRRILSADPGHIDSLHLLGVVLTQSGRHREAIDLIGRAIALRPAPAAPFHANIALAYRGLGAKDDAIAHLQKAIALKPDYQEAHSNLGAVFLDANRLEEAERHCRRALALRPDSAPAQFALGAVLQRRGAWEQAKASYERAIALQPSYPEAWNNLGSAQMALDAPEQAAAAFRHALALKPAYAKAHFNLGAALQECGDFAQALASYRQALALDPNDADAHWNNGLLHLTLGEFATGWTEYRWRWRREGYAQRSFAAPAWDGSDLSGRTILLYAEQGIGDTLQFVRYAPLVKAKGSSAVILECQNELAGLLQGADGMDRIVPRGGNDVPAFDCHASLPDLPRLFGTTMTTIPAAMPYLCPSPERAAAWRERLAVRTNLKVGLVWRGNPGNTRDRQRSIPVEMIAGIGDLPGVAWLGLQIDPRPEEIVAMSRSGDFTDLGSDLGDWADTAALISALDLVVTVDTAVAHLAGALGKPVWVLLAHVAHWCWHTNPNASPWYPTARLFRQQRRGDWAGVVAEVREALARFAQ